MPAGIHKINRIIRAVRIPVQRLRIVRVPSIAVLRQKPSVPWRIIPRPQVILLRLAVIVFARIPNIVPVVFRALRVPEDIVAVLAQRRPAASCHTRHISAPVVHKVTAAASLVRPDILQTDRVFFRRPVCCLTDQLTPVVHVFRLFDRLSGRHLFACPQVVSTVTVLDCPASRFFCLH